MILLKTQIFPGDAQLFRWLDKPCIPRGSQAVGVVRRLPNLSKRK